MRIARFTTNSPPGYLSRRSRSSDTYTHRLSRVANIPSVHEFHPLGRGIKRQALGTHKFELLFEVEVEVAALAGDA